MLIFSDVDASQEEILFQAHEENASNNIDINESLPYDASEEMQARKRRVLTNDERHAVYLALLERSVDGKLQRDTTGIVAEMFSTKIRNVQRIWERAQENQTSGVVDVSHRKTKNCGRKRVQIDLEQFRNIPYPQRTTLESIASNMQVSKSTLHRNFQSGIFRRHSNAIKPFLRDENKKSRLQFCLSMLDSNSLPHDPKFVDMNNIIHIDEKWFYITRKSENYYLLPDEDEPHRSCKSKNFVEKVMFLAAVARPRFDAEGNETFSGKIGIFPFVTKEPAKRRSVNRAAGTLETKVMTSVGKSIIRSFLIEKVLPAVRAKWPSEDSNKPIFIQQDNARTHVDPDDEEFCRAAAQDGFNIRLMCQPANSPDLNILDLGFFNAIQSMNRQAVARTLDGLIHAVENAFEVFSPVKSNRVFLTLQLCMVEIMKARGSNKYKIPHINKAALEREDRLPRIISCDAKLVEDVQVWLS